jgi:hypothetical protein
MPTPGVHNQLAHPFFITRLWPAEPETSTIRPQQPECCGLNCVASSQIGRTLSADSGRASCPGSRYSDRLESVAR